MCHLGKNFAQKLNNLVMIMDWTLKVTTELVRKLWKRCLNSALLTIPTQLIFGNFLIVIPYEGFTLD